MTSSSGPDPQAVAAAFAELVDTVAMKQDTEDMLGALCDRCVDLFGVTAAAVVLNSKDDELRIAATTVDSRWVRNICTDIAGPVGEAVYRATPITGPTSGRVEVDHPDDSPGRREQRITSTYAVPTRAETTTWGAVGLFQQRSTALTMEDAGIAQCLADTAAACLTQRDALDCAQARADQLQGAHLSPVS